MTGIERLRRLASDMRDSGWQRMHDDLAEIADKIEREASDKTVRADDPEGLYEENEGLRDMLNQVAWHLGLGDEVHYYSGDNYAACQSRVLDVVDGLAGRESDVETVRSDAMEAWRWVCDHGGLDEVSRMFQDADNRRVELCGALGIDLDTGWSDAMAAMRLRLMPEGVEWLLEVWPRWSNGEYCRFGDWWTADRYGDYEPRQLRRLVFYTPEQLREWEQDEGDNFGYEWDFMRPSDTTYRPDKAEPPTPKVLDAGGVDTSVGDTVYDVDTGEKMWVCALPEQGAYQCVKLRLINGTFKTLDPCRLTHRAPVLAADGRPLREGETVYGVNTGYAYTVTGFNPTTDEDGDPCVMVVCKTESDRRVDVPSNRLTHERPQIDSWERVEEDARGLDSGADCGMFTYTHEDLVRRCRALAER